MSSKLRRNPVRIGGDDAGGTAMEFALVSPMMIVLLIGAIQLGWVLHCASSVRWALEASSRSLVIDPDKTATDIRTAMVQRLSGIADSSDLTVTITPSEADKTLVVASIYKAKLGIPLVPIDTLTFNSSVTVPELE